MAPEAAIRLVVLDVDGVLTDGEAAPLDLGVAGLLAGMNDAARHGAGAAVTLCTGRPGPYVEALLQVLHGRIPAVFEGGAGLYLPEGCRSVAHPGLGDLSSVRECRRLLEAAAVDHGRFFLQPGKEYTASVFPSAPAALDGGLPRLREEVAAVLGPLANLVELRLSASCVNLAPAGCDKAAGLRLLAETTRIPARLMLGIGDSEVDAPFLAAVGASAAPANAAAEVRAAVDYTSPLRSAAAVRDILRHFGLIG